MTINATLVGTELQRVLWACLNYWDSEAIPTDERVVCYSWVARVYENRFGGVFHQSRLQRLAQLGFLTEGDTSRGGNRRYYRISDPTQLAEFLRACTLN